MRATDENAMERSNTEPLLAEDEFSELLRDNSLLNRTGSGIFNQLMNDSPPPLHVQMTQQDHQYAQQIPFVEVVAIDQRQAQLQEQQEQQQPHPQQQQQIEQPQDQLFPNMVLSSVWDNLEEDLDEGMSVSLGPSSDIGMVTTDCITVSEGLSVAVHNTIRAPSIVAWPGRYAFQITMPTENRERNKWCYSTVKSRLYVCPKIAVPVSVSVNEWFIDGSITITPVYQKHESRMEPVNRCFNCKNTQVPERDASLEDHVVQVEGEGGRYEIVGERYQVSVPLQPPQMGEYASTILIKVMCLTSCLGGPNRRPFVLVFTLKNKDGEVIGRQILDVKCCKCPSRDMTNEEKQHAPRSVPQAPRLDDEKRAKVRKLASEIVVGQGQQKKKPRIKLEPGTQNQLVNVAVPKKFEAYVKRVVNQLIAEDLIKQSSPHLMLYPEEEDSN